MDSIPLILHHLFKILLNRFDPIPKGYPFWFIIMFPDVILWASFGDGHQLILNWLDKLVKKNTTQIMDEKSNKFNSDILEEIIKKILQYNSQLECSKLKV